MIPLFRLCSWRHARRHPLRLLLGISSVALGVALFVSVETSHLSTVRSFEKTLLRLAGKADVRVTRGRQIGIEEEAVKRVEESGGVPAAPVLQLSTTIADGDGGPMLVLGIDWVRERHVRDLSIVRVEADPLRVALDPGAVLVTSRLAERRSLSLGSALRLNTPSGIRRVRVAGILDDTGPVSVFGGNVLVMGIRGAQQLFGRTGTVDRIDVATGGDPEAAQRIRAALGPEYRVEPIRARSSILDEVLSRVRALVAVSVIALMVSIFIIYLSVSVGVVERTKEIGTMRALGASRGQMLGIFLGEAAALGLCGSFAGLPLGAALARGLTEYTAQNVNTLQFLIHVDEIELSPLVIAASLAVGCLTSLLAALVPSLRATSVSPLEALRPASFRMSGAARTRRACVAGLLLMAAGAAVVLDRSRALPPWCGLAATAFVFLGLAFALPYLTIQLSRIFRPLLRALFRVEGFLASDNVMRYPQRTALTVVAFGGAVSMMVALASVIASLERSTDRWMDQAFPWDLSVQATDHTQALYSTETLPAGVLERVLGVEGVARAFAIKTCIQEYGEKDILLVAIDMKAYFDMMREKRYRTRGMPEDPQAVEALRRGEAVGVSENFTRLYGAGPGGFVELETPKGSRRFRIAHSLEDYSWPQGVLALDLAVYRELWSDSSVSYVDIRLASGHTVAQVRGRLGGALQGEYRTFVYTKEDIVGFGRKALGQSFQLVHVQVIVAMLIGFLGIVNTLLISVLTRSREIGLQRAVGMTRGQVARAVVIESVFVAFVGGTVGVVCGLLAAAFPIAIHFDRVTGYLISFTVPWGTVGLALGVSWIIGLVASWLPSRRAAAVNVLEAIGYE